MSYIDGVLCAVSNDRKEEYRAYAETVWALFHEHGATRMCDAWEEDVPEGDLTSFPKAVKRLEGEAVVFAWLEWPDKATRDAAWAALEDDPRFSALAEMPFDGQRMVFGGFVTLFSAKA